MIDKPKTRMESIIKENPICDNIFAREIWNAAIEKAAKVGEKEWRLTEIGNEIRKLKV